MNIKSIRLEQVMRFSMKGSFLKGTAKGDSLGLETHVHVESDEPVERVRELIRIGEQTCFSLQTVVNSVPAETHVTLNGEALPTEDQSRG